MITRGEERIHFRQEKQKHEPVKRKLPLFIKVLILLIIVVCVNKLLTEASEIISSGKIIVDSSTLYDSDDLQNIDEAITNINERLADIAFGVNDSGQYGYYKDDELVPFNRDKVLVYSGVVVRDQQIDIHSSCSGYKDLSIDNFVIEVTELSFDTIENAGGLYTWCEKRLSRSSVTYNSNTGVLTLTGFGANVVAGNQKTDRKIKANIYVIN